ncbi:hypothetical protein RRSWK_00495 [Rhodopirellula sp. SWK7]|nr:hypothetical protein RRSWK_00495 [Rhodopirellula sp. SWK7]
MGFPSTTRNRRAHLSIDGRPPINHEHATPNRHEARINRDTD